MDTLNVLNIIRKIKVKIRSIVINFVLLEIVTRNYYLITDIRHNTFIRSTLEAYEYVNESISITINEYRVGKHTQRHTHLGIIIDKKLTWGATD